ncbi:response regulator [uncultured Abyssibacter sp.]|uniref:response regulator n=1 Tax=uncultured Abyssibacter sp. TaxID=2320202 RepID=UPI0032B2CBC8
MNPAVSAGMAPDAGDKELPRILCVDDEPNLLAGLERTLFEGFDVTTATSGALGLEFVESEPPFAVIMSDMRMPGMDGAEFLARVRERSPNSTRILLTGQADTKSAIAAINHGAIFRYLCKPCPSDVLIPTLNEAVERHRSAVLERDMMETTLSGVVDSMTQVLGLIAPWASMRSATIQACVKQAAGTLGWPNAWIGNMAAALSHIGCVSVPSDIVQREMAGLPLNAEEREILDSHPEIAFKLLQAIPRLDPVAQVVRYQNQPAPVDADPDVVLGAELLRAASVLARELASQQPMARALEAVAELDPPVRQAVRQALRTVKLHSCNSTRRARVNDLVPGWVVAEDIKTRQGGLVLGAGRELTVTAIMALRNLLASDAIEEPLLVACPETDQSFPGA